jgi:tRNA A37 threonylcarbamoyladenosine synthetase subunit TsaC/SUA5/YrdC
MKVITLRDNHEEAINIVSRAISYGGLVAVPTDTVYGIIGNETDTKAISCIYDLKKRPK